MGQAPKHESRDKITELEAEKGDAKMTLVPCIMALSVAVLRDLKLSPICGVTPHNNSPPLAHSGTECRSHFLVVN